jgi:hypothetical protein
MKAVMKQNQNRRAQFDLADILRDNKLSFSERYNLFQQQEKAYQDICACRTAQLKGHIAYCNCCNYKRQAYNSCRNKHCPKCQFIKQAKWVDKLQSRLLDCKHFHLVFTIPHQLNGLVYLNQKKLYDALFSSAWEAVSKATNNPKFLGAQTGAVAVLHTWTQTLNQHPHIHMIIPSGGLSDDQMEWIPCRNNFLAPKRVISSLFRGIFCHNINKAIKNNELVVPEQFKWTCIKNALYKTKWNVNIQKPISGVNAVVKYLGRYTNRVAIDNARITDTKNGKVSFRYKDRKRLVSKTMQLDTLEFIRRFMLHILPHNFYKIRYYGILASTNSQTKRQQVSALMETCIAIPEYEGLSAIEVYSLITGKDVSRCPKCRKGRILCRALPGPET